MTRKSKCELRGHKVKDVTARPYGKCLDCGRTSVLMAWTRNPDEGAIPAWIDKDWVGEEKNPSTYLLDMTPAKPAVVIDPQPFDNEGYYLIAYEEQRYVVYSIDLEFSNA